MRGWSSPKPLATKLLLLSGPGNVLIRPCPIANEESCSCTGFSGATVKGKGEALVELLVAVVTGHASQGLARVQLQAG